MDDLFDTADVLSDDIFNAFGNIFDEDDGEETEPFTNASEKVDEQSDLPVAKDSDKDVKDEKTFSQTAAKDNKVSVMERLSPSINGLPAITSEAGDISKERILLLNIPASCSVTKLQKTLDYIVDGSVRLENLDGIYGGCAAVRVAPSHAIKDTAVMLNGASVGDNDIIARIMSARDDKTFYHKKRITSTTPPPRERDVGSDDDEITERYFAHLVLNGIKVVIKNIPPKMTSSELKKILKEKVAPMEEIRLISGNKFATPDTIHNGWGFVFFKTTAAAENFSKKCDGFKIGDKKKKIAVKATHGFKQSYYIALVEKSGIRLDFTENETSDTNFDATEPNDSQPEASEPNDAIPKARKCKPSIFRLAVSNVPLDVTAAELEEIFSSEVFCNVKVILKKGESPDDPHTGQGLVFFKSENNAKQAFDLLDGHDLGGCRMTLTKNFDENSDSYEEFEPGQGEGAERSGEDVADLDSVTSEENAADFEFYENEKQSVRRSSEGGNQSEDDDNKEGSHTPQRKIETEEIGGVIVFSTLDDMSDGTSGETFTVNVCNISFQMSLEYFINFVNEKVTGLLSLVPFLGEDGKHQGTMIFNFDSPSNANLALAEIHDAFVSKRNLVAKLVEIDVGPEKKKQLEAAKKRKLEAVQKKKKDVAANKNKQLEASRIKKKPEIAELRPPGDEDFDGFNSTGAAGISRGSKLEYKIIDGVTMFPTLEDMKRVVREEKFTLQFSNISYDTSMEKIIKIVNDTGTGATSMVALLDNNGRHKGSAIFNFDSLNNANKCLRKIHGFMINSRNVIAKRVQIEAPPAGVLRPMDMGPPPMGMGPPPMGMGPPPMGMGPMGMGPPPMDMGPPPMDMGMGPPPMGMGPPQRGMGPPQMGMGPPQMGMGPPQMGMGPPQSYPGDPSMGYPPQSYQGDPSMGYPPQSYQGDPSMGYPPQNYPGDPSMGYPPQSYTADPSMGYPPQSYPADPSMGYPAPQPPSDNGSYAHYEHQQKQPQDQHQVLTEQQKLQQEQQDLKQQELDELKERLERQKQELLKRQQDLSKPQQFQEQKPNRLGIIGKSIQPPKVIDMNTHGLTLTFLESLGINLPLVKELLVINIDTASTEDDVRELFSIAGTVVKVQYNQMKGQAIIEMGTQVDAVQSISMLHNQEYFDQIITVRLLRSNDPENLVTGPVLKSVPRGLKTIGKGLGPKGIPLNIPPIPSPGGVASLSYDAQQLQAGGGISSGHGLTGNVPIEMPLADHGRIGSLYANYNLGHGFPDGATSVSKPAQLHAGGGMSSGQVLMGNVPSEMSRADHGRSDSVYIDYNHKQTRKGKSRFSDDANLQPLSKKSKWDVRDTGSSNSSVNNYDNVNGRGSSRMDKQSNSRNNSLAVSPKKSPPNQEMADEYGKYMNLINGKRFSKGANSRGAQAPNKSSGGALSKNLAGGATSISNIKDPAMSWFASTANNSSTVGREVIFTNLPGDARQDVVREMCAKYGAVHGVQINRTCKTGRVTFKQHRSAVSAAKALYNEKYNGAKIKTTLA